MPNWKQPAARARRWAADPRVDTARQYHRRAAGRRAAAARSLQAPGVLRSGGGTHLSSRGLYRRAPGGSWGCRAAASGAAFYAAELAEASQGLPGAWGGVQLQQLRRRATSAPSGAPFLSHRGPRPPAARSHGSGSNDCRLATRSSQPTATGGA